MSFGEAQVGNLTISQINIKNPGKSHTTFAADITAREEIKDPYEIALVFYDTESTRIGRATALLANGLPAGRTTTLNFDFDEPTILKGTTNMRIEAAPQSPLMLMERAAKKISNATK